MMLTVILSRTTLASKKVGLTKSVLGKIHELQNLAQ